MEVAFKLKSEGSTRLAWPVSGKAKPRGTGHYPAFPLVGEHPREMKMHVHTETCSQKFSPVRDRQKEEATESIRSDGLAGSWLCDKTPGSNVICTFWQHPDAFV